MTHLSGHDRSQLLLLPEAVDDYVGPDTILGQIIEVADQDKRSVAHQDLLGAARM